MTEGKKKPRTIYCTKEEWAWVSTQAKASGMSIGQYLVHCGLTVEIPEGGVEKPTGESALTPEEQRQLFDNLEELVKLNKTQLGKDGVGWLDMLGMVRVCFERARADYLDKYGSLAYEDLMKEVQRGPGGETGQAEPS